MNNKKTYKMVVMALFIAIEIVLAMTPLGYIPIGAIRATTLHIPVILAGVVFGVKEGALIGLVFGLTSLFNNTFSPTPASFLFSPFYNGGNFGSLIICLVPRVLIGVVSAYAYQGISKLTNIVSKAAIPVAAVLGSLTNTTLVLLGMYVFFKDAYAAYRGIAANAVAGVLLAQLSVNGVLEAIVAMVLSSAIGLVLFKIIKK